MNDLKIVFLGVLGTIFILFGIYSQANDPAKSIAYEYIGMGSWLAGLLYFGLFKKYNELASLIIGLIILHSGVLLLLLKISDTKIIGFLLFTAGIVVALNSGFSEYIKRRRGKA